MEQTAHVHRCACGATWRCEKADCFQDDDCTACAVQQFEEWAESHALTTYQPVLEPETALLAKEKK